MRVRLHVREVIDIDVPDFIALETARCNKYQSNRWTMRADWHEKANDMNRFLDSAVREALLAKIRSPNDDSPVLVGWYERPDASKDMP